MPFKKGKQKTGGKVKGNLNRKTIEWDEFGKELTSHGITRAKMIMDDADDEKFMLYFNGLLNYFKPKLASTQANVTGELKQTIVQAISKSSNEINKL